MNPLAADYTIWLNTPDGERVKLADGFTELEATLATNSVSTARITFPESEFNRDLVQPDSVLEIYRSIQGREVLLGQQGWFVRRMDTDLDSQGRLSYTMWALSGSTLLDSRVVAYASGTAFTSKSGPADDVMYEFVMESLSSDATDADRQLSSEYFTVAEPLSAGPNVAISATRRNLLKVLQTIAADAANEGTPVFFDVTYGPRESGLFTFRTYTQQRGADLTGDAADRVLISPAQGNLSEARLIEDYTEEVTVAYVGGQGQGAARVVVEVTSPRELRSRWNRREIFHSLGQVVNDSGGGLTSAGSAQLRRGRPRRYFRGIVQDTPHTRFGVHYNWGDRVPWQFDRWGGTALVESVRINVSKGRETIRPGLRVDDTYFEDA